MAGRVRTSLWPIVRIALIVLTLVVVGSFLWIRAVANEQWDRMTARIAELEVERQAEPVIRPTLRGSPEPGNAWADYAQALAQVPQMARNSTIIHFFEDSWLPASLAPVTATLPQMEAWAAPCDPALDRLRLGTRRGEIRPTIVWEHRFTPLMVELDRAWVPVWEMSHAGIVKARLLIERGQSDEAVALLMDLCQFGLDALNGTDIDGCKIGVQVLYTLSFEFRRMLTSKGLSTAALQRLDRELGVLDGNWPSGVPTLRNQLLGFGRGCREEAEIGSLMYLGREARSFRSWRWGYSARFRAASTFLRADLVVRLMIQESEGRSSDDPSLSSWSALSWPDPVLEGAFRHYTSASPAICERATMRVLRTGARFLATGEVPDLSDPFGDRLERTVQGNKLRVWSVGADRLDQGGVEDGWTYGRDIVLDV